MLLKGVVQSKCFGNRRFCRLQQFKYLPSVSHQELNIITSQKLIQGVYKFKLPTTRAILPRLLKTILTGLVVVMVYVCCTVVYQGNMQASSSNKRSAVNKQMDNL